MAWHLFRLGRWSFVHRKVVALVWVALLVLGGVGASTLAGQTTDDFELDGIESTDAFALIEERTPQASTDGATAQLVFEAPEGESFADPATAAAVNDAITGVQSEHVSPVADPSAAELTVSENGRVALATISYGVPAPELTDADRSALESVRDSADEAGLSVAIGGDALQEVSFGGAAELIGVVIALVVLTMTFGSLLAAGMPLLTAVLGVGIGITGIFTLSGFVDLSSVTPALGSMLGLAVGIDYALFIMSRYRSEVHRGRTPEEAAGVAVGTAGSAVVFAGLTVVIALAGLSVVGIPFLTQMGLGGAATVAIAVLIALTLLPALLGFAGRRVTHGGLRFLKQRDPENDTTRTNGRRWVELVTRFRWPMLVGGLLVAAVVAFPVTKMELALPDNGSASEGTDARVAYDTISENFGPGTNGPLIVVVDTEGADDPGAAVQAAVQEISSLTDDVAAVIPPALRDDAASQTALQQQLAAVNYATVTVIPKSGPSDAATQDLVDDLRDQLADLPDETGARALVTGQTAVGVDISQKLQDVFPLYLVIVVGLAVFLLIAVFRSIWVPIKAALGFVVSLGVALGATVAVFQWGWLNELLGLDSTSPVVFILPLLLTGILFGLAMDYEVFLVTRMREAYVHGTEAREAVREGFEHSARVVTAAAVIMMGVFAGFALEDDPIIKSIGFALAIGVFVDAFLVRMVLVPAVMSVVGKRIWWMPKFFEPITPKLDIEGDSLLKRLSGSYGEEPGKHAATEPAGRHAK
jgi:putative drug exporter of the RND superfamily